MANYEKSVKMRTKSGRALLSRGLSTDIYADIVPVAWNFKQCHSGMCDKQSLRPACAYAQTDQSLCKCIEYYMAV